jgi:outer membrane protein
MIHRPFISRILYWTFSMMPKLPFASLAFCLAALAQAPSQTPPPLPAMPGVPPQSGAQAAPGPAVTLNFTSALQRAQQYSQQVLAANYAALLAREDRVQAKAGLLPSANVFNQFIYTQPNDTPSGIFVPNDGPHIYAQYLQVHGDIYSPGKIADYRRTMAAEAVARARYQIATRGLVAVVVQNYYGMLAAQHKVTSAQQGVSDAQQFLDITRKQEAGGEAAHADVVKAELQFEQRRIDLSNAQLDLEKARIGFSVILFPNYGQMFTLVDDLESGSALPPLPDIRRLASTNNPDIRAAEATVEQQTYELKSSRALLYPTLSFDYFYGIDANQYALHNPEGKNLLGSVAQAQLTIPVWTWGATRSRIRQSEIRLRQARTDLSFTQRQLLANLDAFYGEANLSRSLLDALRRSVTLAEESLRLTNLRYQAGEATALEVVDAQTTLLQARNAYADGLLRYRLALANLQTLTGAF